MADAKISALDAVVTPADTDIFAVTQAGEVNVKSRKETRAQVLTAFPGSVREFDIQTQLFEHMSTGLHSGGIVTINGGDNTKFDVAEGSGDIVDQVAVTFEHVSWITTTAIAPITADGIIYVYVPAGGSISQTTTVPNSEFYRENIVLGRVITRSGVVIAAQMQPNLDAQVADQIVDLNLGIGLINLSGNILSPNGANLKFDKSIGYLYGQGINYATNVKIPHTATMIATAPTTFQMTTRNASSGSDVTDLDVSNYDLGGVITAIPGGTNVSTNFRVYLFPSGNVRVQYGQNTYPSLSQAVQAVPTESFQINSSIPGNGILIGIISVIKSAGDLSDPSEAKFFAVNKFGDVGIGAAGSSVSSLQDAYDNGASPTITLTSARGAVAIKDAATPIGANLLQVTDVGPTNTFFSVDSTGVKGSSSDFYTWFPWNVLYVAPEGAEFTTISAAITAANALTPSTTNRVTIFVAQSNIAAGYTADITIASHVALIGIGENVLIEGTLTLTGSGYAENLKLENVLTGSTPTTMLDVSGISSNTIVSRNIDITYSSLVSGLTLNGVYLGSANCKLENINVKATGSSTSTLNGFMGSSGSPSGVDLYNCHAEIVNASGTSTAYGYLDRLFNCTHSVTASTKSNYVGVNNVFSGNTSDILYAATSSGTYTVGSEEVILYTGTTGSTISLPASPRDGQKVRVVDEGGNAGTSAITVSGNGKNIAGSATQTINVNYGSLSLIYTSTAGEWI